MVLVNSKKPYGDEARQTARELQEEYHVTAIPVNCEQLKEEDIHKILEAVLYEFPVSEIQFFIPKWVEMLPSDHRIKQDLLQQASGIMEAVSEIKDAASLPLDTESPYISGIRLDHIEMNTGRVAVRIEIHESHYYEMLSEMTGIPITGQYELISAMKQLSESREEYEEIKDAFLSVKMKGYGVVSPRKEEIHLDDLVAGRLPYVVFERRRSAQMAAAGRTGQNQNSHKSHTAPPPCGGCPFLFKIAAG